MKLHPKLVYTFLFASVLLSCQKEDMLPVSVLTTFKGTLSIVETHEEYNCNPMVTIQSSHEILEMEEFSEDSVRFSVGNCRDKVFKKNSDQIYISELIEGAQTKILLHNDSIDFLHRQFFTDGKSFRETKWLFVGREIK